MKRLQIPPAALFAAAGLTQRMLIRKSRSTTPTSRAAAVSVAAGSVGMLSASVLRFRRYQTTLSPVDIHKASTLVTAGPYRISRNPIYLGLAGLLVAHALLYKSGLAILPAAAFIAVIDRSQIPAEEAGLYEQFGSDFAAYRSRVSRWVGSRRQ